ncbi:membrane protein insertase YidC [Demequina sp.]|uniref:membrane protein insertase YidC n=1 Tax=Demequina sp. TaxID=2050685 RepID=UPI003D0F4ED6
MSFINTIMYPLEWVVAAIMVVWHNIFTFFGLNPAGGAAWGFAIVGLVVTIRVILIPLFVKQIKASRAMQMIAPELKAVQAKYKGKKDQASREAMSRETMELYAKHRTNPFSSCMPMLLQAPIFFALFQVLNNKLKSGGIGLLTPELAAQAEQATIFGAKLSESFTTSEGSAAKIVSAVLIIAMVATTFTTQRQLTRKNMPQSALDGPMARQQQMIMYALPFIFIITGPNFPVGVLIYWTTTNLWTMGQQYYVIKRNPTPGSEAERVFLEKKAAKDQARAIKRGETTLEEIEAEKQAAIEAARGQRQQPKKAGSRAKRSGATAAKPAESKAVVPEPQGELEATEEETTPAESAPAAPAPKAKSGQRTQPKKKK